MSLKRGQKIHGQNMITAFFKKQPYLCNTQSKSHKVLDKCINKAQLLEFPDYHTSTFIMFSHEHRGLVRYPHGR